MSEPTKEYWQAKANLCRDLALLQLYDSETTAEANKNLMRMSYALSKIGIINAKESEGK